MYNVGVLRFVCPDCLVIRDNTKLKEEILQTEIKINVLENENLTTVLAPFIKWACLTKFSEAK